MILLTYTTCDYFLLTFFFIVSLDFGVFALAVSFLAVTFFIGIYFCDKTGKDLGVQDHGAIVWDEFVGFWLTMMFAPAGFLWLLVGFCLFRLFDIWKPWPINYLDKHVHGGLGVMLDDVLAGVFAGLLLYLVSIFVTF